MKRFFAWVRNLFRGRKKVEPAVLEGLSLEMRRARSTKRYEAFRRITSVEEGGRADWVEM